jgi:hypothetical protein
MCKEASAIVAGEEMRMTAIVGFVIGLACGAMVSWILLALARKPGNRSV